MSERIDGEFSSLNETLPRIYWPTMTRVNTQLRKMNI